MSPWITKVISTELRKILAYRSDFWVNFIGNTLIHLAVSRALWQSIFLGQGVDQMRGMTLDQLTLYYVLAPLSVKVLMGENIGFFSREIYDGGLNRYLIWPMPALGYKALTYLTHSTFYLLQLAFLYLVARTLVIDAHLELQDLIRLVAGLAYLFVAAMGFFFLMALCEMISFWFDNAWTLGVMLKFALYFLGGTLVPLTFYPGELQQVISYLPFASMASAPIKLILGHATPLESWQSFAVLVAWIPVLAMATAFMWRRGNLRYTGVGM